ncbi:MAG: response regulator transcription factor [Clostridiaceae bacterium]
MANKKILVADDESRMRRLVSDFLKKDGFEIVEAADGKEAIDEFSKCKFDLVILDVMMPIYDGWEVCKIIRENSDVPIIMLTAREEEADEIFGFTVGADEYITKPFSPLVFVARVHSLLRRVEGENVNIYEYPGLIIDGDKHNVEVEGRRIDLTPKEFELILYMVENEGLALSRDKILNAVWDYDYFGDPRTVDTHIKRIRLKLREKGEYVHTVRNLGYKFEVV